MKVTIPPISTKRAIIPHLSTLNTKKKKHKKLTLGQVQKYTYNLGKYTTKKLLFTDYTRNQLILVRL